MFLIRKKGDLLNLSLEEFERCMEIEYLEGLEFPHKLSKKITKLYDKAKAEERIDPKWEWLSVLYQGDKTPKISLHWLGTNLGWGVFAEEEIKPHTFIGEYAGVVRKRKDNLDRTNPYCFEYSVGFALETPYTIDARDKGNMMRFVNHSANPNLEPFPIFHNKLMHIGLRTKFLVSKGAQLTYDYGTQYWKQREKPIAL